MRQPFVALVVTSCLFAQQVPDPFRFVPADAAFVVRMKGLAGWRAELGATGLGKVFAAAGPTESWRRLLAAGKKELDPEGAHERRLAGLLEVLAGHTGEIVLAGRVDFAQMSETQPPQFSLSLAVTGDGSTELERLAKEIEGLLPDGATSRQVAGHERLVHTVPGGELTAPFVSDGALVLLWASQLDGQAEPFLASRETKFAAAPGLQRGVLGIQIEAHEPLRALLEAMPELPDERFAGIVKGMELAGVRSVQRLAYSLFADGAYVGQEACIEFAPGARGLFDVVLPARAQNPRLLQYLPPGTQNWGIGTFDVPALQALYAQVFEQFGADIPKSREELEGLFTEFTKLRLHEDFLSLIGDEYLRIDDFAAVEDPTEEGDPRLEKLDERMGDSCYAVRLRDGKAMAQNLEKALRARGLHAGRKTEEYGDTKIHRLRLLGSMPIEYAFAGDLFVLGIGGGKGTEQHLRSVLDTVAARGKGAVAAELSAPVQARLQGWPADWATIDVGVFTEILDGITGTMDAVVAMVAEEEVDPEDLGIWHDLAGFGRQLRPELVRHGADVAVTAGYSARDVYVMRSRW